MRFVAEVFSLESLYSGSFCTTKVNAYFASFVKSIALWIV